MVFLHCRRFLYCGIPAVFRIHATLGFSAVDEVLLLTFLLLLALTMILVFPFDVVVPAVTGVPSLFSIHAVVRHSAVDSCGKFATAVVVDTGGAH
jgi:hypothetical protein